MAGFIYKVDVIARDSGGWLVDLMYVVLSCVDSVAANMRYRASKHFNYIAALWWIDRSTRNNIFSLSLSLSIATSVFTLHINVLRTLDRQTLQFYHGWGTDRYVVDDKLFSKTL